MPKVITVVKKFKLSDFIVEVNERLNEGWEFHGFTTPVGTGDAVCYIQALVRNAPAEGNMPLAAIANALH